MVIGVWMAKFMTKNDRSSRSTPPIRIGGSAPTCWATPRATPAAGPRSLAPAPSLRAIDEQAESFHGRFGFRPFPDREPLMLMLRVSGTRRVAGSSKARRCTGVGWVATVKRCWGLSGSYTVFGASMAIGSESNTCQSAPRLARALDRAWPGHDLRPPDRDAPSAVATGGYRAIAAESLLLKHQFNSASHHPQDPARFRTGSGRCMLIC